MLNFTRLVDSGILTVDDEDCSYVRYSIDPSSTITVTVNSKYYEDQVAPVIAVEYSKLNDIWSVETDGSLTEYGNPIITVDRSKIVTVSTEIDV